LKCTQHIARIEAPIDSGALRLMDDNFPAIAASYLRALAKAPRHPLPGLGSVRMIRIPIPGA
jgi:hypothetical protein